MNLDSVRELKLFFILQKIANDQNVAVEHPVRTAQYTMKVTSTIVSGSHNRRRTMNRSTAPPAELMFKKELGAGPPGRPPILTQICC